MHLSGFFDLHIVIGDDWRVEFSYASSVNRPQSFHLVTIISFVIPRAIKILPPRTGKTYGRDSDFQVSGSPSQD